jgi:NAD(P)-dependent dehydrogenase (short-subunit alcohol dehydrogenase family)
MIDLMRRLKYREIDREYNWFKADQHGMDFVIDAASPLIKCLQKHEYAFELLCATNRQAVWQVAPLATSTARGRCRLIKLHSAPSFRLDGKRALVSGAGRGIGLAAASALADSGAHVTLLSRTRGEIEEAAAAIRARGQQADALVLDVTDLPAMQKAIATAAPFNILINNAGTNRPKPLMDVSIEDYDAIMGLNVRAAYFVAQAVARRLIEAKQSGSIINISSQMGHVGAARRTVYCASKHAMEGFTKAMAIELAPHNIRVNSLGPTFLETPMTRPFFENKAFRDEVLGKIKLGRLGQLDELTGAILFLASDASSLMTGSALVLDGGWTAE